MHASAIPYAFMSAPANQGLSLADDYEKILSIAQSYRGMCVQVFGDSLSDNGNNGSPAQADFLASFCPHSHALLCMLLCCSAVMPNLSTLNNTPPNLAPVTGCLCIAQLWADTQPLHCLSLPPGLRTNALAMPCSLACVGTP